jgi:hypothetical protein
MVQETYDHDGTSADLALGGEPAGPQLARRPGCATA